MAVGPSTAEITLNEASARIATTTLRTDRLSSTTRMVSGALLNRPRTTAFQQYRSLEKNASGMWKVGGSDNDELTVQLYAFRQKKADLNCSVYRLPPGKARFESIY